MPKLLFNRNVGLQSIGMGAGTMQGGKRACTRYPHTLPSIVELYHGIMNKIRPKTMMLVDVLPNSISSTAFSLIQLIGFTDFVDVVS